MILRWTAIVCSDKEKLLTPGPTGNVTVAAGLLGR